MKRLSIAAIVLTVLSACSEGGNQRVFVSGGEIGGLTPKGEVIRRPSGGLVVSEPARASVPQTAPVRRGGRSVAPPSPPSAAVADTFARNFLNSIQARSFRERRELCGYFVQLPNGQITATPPVPGNFASCEQLAPQPGQGIFASYHTHGAYGPQYDNEVPSTTDLLSDFEFGIDGYVSTPGGRIWRVENDTREAIQVCGQGCVAVDPGFVPEGEAFILPRYTLTDLARRGS
ncbi:DUF4329 domain-containing protein [Yoonia sp. 208BN28-4]|uniref:DUF4329 domain-containing protein n=1 Tax=Yoonia sp. 208BN28-4 TaxID=3126505 RepID=UPI0030989ECF